jgi:regulator of protease activity HflC (stomatin/prohibitin superfamily)
MIWIFLTIVLGIAFWGGLVVTQRTQAHSTKMRAALASGAAVLLWLLVTGAFSVHTVGQRQIGIVYNFSGTISGKVDAGVVWTAPWQHVRTENVGIQSEEFDLDTNNSAVSLDQQQVYARLFINFQVEPSHVVQLYKTVGPNWKQILLDARVLQDFKETTAQYPAADITRKRPELRAITRQRLEQELSKYDIRVVDFFVKNVGFSDAYDQAITARNVQAQQALQAEAKVAQVKAEADQAVAQARGEAQAIALKGRALRNNPEILRLTAIEKLNPNVQVMYVPAGANMFFGASPSTTPTK